jgi:hypothetical protein
VAAFLTENWQTGAALLVAGFCAGWVAVRVLAPFSRRRREEEEKGPDSPLIEIDPPSRN